MSVQARKKRQLAEREQLFLDRAWELIQQEGVLDLQMSRLAKDCEYAVGTLYLHFSCKEDLLVELAACKLGERIELFQKAANWPVGSRMRILAILIADTIFARRAPEFFRLTQYVSTHTVWRGASEQRRARALDHCKPLEEALVSVVRRAREDGDLPAINQEDKDLLIGLWSMSQGVHSMVSASGFLESECVPRAYQLLMYQANALLNGLGWQPLVDINDEQQLKQQCEQIMAELFPDIPLTECPATESSALSASLSNSVSTPMQTSSC